MTHADVTQQTLVEHDLLRYLMEGLRATVGWQVEGQDGSRKLSTLRFITQSFQRHIERLMALEEYDGYMEVVRAMSPQLARRVDALRSEHDRLREGARRVVHHFEQVQPTDLPGLCKVGDELLGLLHTVEEHSRKEVALLQEAVAQESGGEG